MYNKMLFIQNPALDLSDDAPGRFSYMNLTDGIQEALVEMDLTTPTNIQVHIHKQ